MLMASSLIIRRGSELGLHSRRFGQQIQEGSVADSTASFFPPSYTHTPTWSVASNCRTKEF
jgi:hypothetical protein